MSINPSHNLVKAHAPPVSIHLASTFSRKLKKPRREDGSRKSGPGGRKDKSNKEVREEYQKNGSFACRKDVEKNKRLRKITGEQWKEGIRDRYA